MRTTIHTLVLISAGLIILRCQPLAVCDVDEDCVLHGYVRCVQGQCFRQRERKEEALPEPLFADEASGGEPQYVLDAGYEPLVDEKLLPEAEFGPDERLQDATDKNMESVPKRFPPASWAMSLIQTVSGFEIHSSAADSKGFLYVVGTFSISASFGSIWKRTQSLNDFFVFKVSPQASDVLWVTTIHCPQGKQCSLAGSSVNAGGELVLTGTYEASVTANNQTRVSLGGIDVFVTKIGTNGSVQWLHSLGSQGDDLGLGVALDDQGNSYVCSYLGGKANLGGSVLSTSGIVLIKYDKGGKLQWFQSAFFDTAHGTLMMRKMKVGPKGTLFLLGAFQEKLVAGTFSHASKGERDIFVGRFALSAQASNRRWLWLRTISGEDTKKASDLIVSKGEEVWISGSFGGATYFDKFLRLVEDLTNPQYTTPFVWKLSKDGTFRWLFTPKGVGIGHVVGLTFFSQDRVAFVGNMSGKFHFGQNWIESNQEVGFLVVISSGQCQELHKLESTVPLTQGLSSVPESFTRVFLVGLFERTLSFGKEKLSAVGPKAAFVGRFSW